MRPPTIIKGQIPADRGTCLRHAVVSLQIHLLVFDAAPETFDKDVVAPGALAVHADRDVILEQHADEVVAGELTAWTPFCLSSGDAGLIDLPVASCDDVEDLTGDVALEGANSIELRMTCAGASGDVGLRR
jgi:hypothetical protein